MQAHRHKSLVIGVGNTLMRDDGVGIHVTNTLRSSTESNDLLDIIDGGTIGLALLPQVEDCDRLIIVDAAELDEPPGTIRVFIDGEVDNHLSGRRRTVHEVAIVDLLSAAEIRGCRPGRTALVAVQPGSTDWGAEPTQRVRDVIPAACRIIEDIAETWNHET